MTLSTTYLAALTPVQQQEFLSSLPSKFGQGPKMLLNVSNQMGTGDQFVQFLAYRAFLSPLVFAGRPYKRDGHLYPAEPGDPKQSLPSKYCDAKCCLIPVWGLVFLTQHSKICLPSYHRKSTQGPNRLFQKHQHFFSDCAALRANWLKKTFWSVKSLLTD